MFHPSEHIIIKGVNKKEEEEEADAPKTNVPLFLRQRASTWSSSVTGNHTSSHAINANNASQHYPLHSLSSTSTDYNTNTAPATPFRLSSTTNDHHTSTSTIYRQGSSGVATTSSKQTSPKSPPINNSSSHDKWLFGFPIKLSSSKDYIKDNSKSKQQQYFKDSNDSKYGRQRSNTGNYVSTNRPQNRLRTVSTSVINEHSIVPQQQLSPRSSSYSFNTGRSIRQLHGLLSLSSPNASINESSQISSPSLSPQQQRDHYHQHQQQLKYSMSWGTNNSSTHSKSSLYRMSSLPTNYNTSATTPTTQQTSISNKILPLYTNTDDDEGQEQELQSSSKLHPIVSPLRIRGMSKESMNSWLEGGSVKSVTSVISLSSPFTTQEKEKDVITMEQQHKRYPIQDEYADLNIPTMSTFDDNHSDPGIFGTESVSSQPMTITSNTAAATTNETDHNDDNYENNKSSLYPPNFNTVISGELESSSPSKKLPLPRPSSFLQKQNYPDYDEYCSNLDLTAQPTMRLNPIENSNNNGHPSKKDRSVRFSIQHDDQNIIVPNLQQEQRNMRVSKPVILLSPKSHTSSDDSDSSHDEYTETTIIENNYNNSMNTNDVHDNHTQKKSILGRSTNTLSTSIMSKWTTEKQKLSKCMPSVSVISSAIVRHAPCFWCNRPETSATDRMILYRLNILVAVFGVVQVAIGIFLLVVLLSEHVADRSCNNYVTSCDENGSSKSFYREALTPSLWTISGMLLLLSLVGLVVVVASILSLPSLQNANLRGALRYLWTLYWILPMEFLFVLSLFDYHNVTTVWIEKWWTGESMAWFRRVFCASGTANRECSVPLDGGPSFASQDEWCLEFFNSTVCSDIRADATDTMSTISYIFFYANAIWGLLLIILMLLSLSILENIISAPIVQSSKETNFPSWLTFPTVGCFAVGFVLLFSPSAILGKQLYWIGVFYVVAGATFCASALLCWFIALKSVLNARDKMQKMITIYVLIAMLTVTLVAVGAIFVASVIYSIDVGFESNERGIIACYLDSVNSCSNCENDENYDPNLTLCPEWTTFDIVKIFQTQLKQSALLSAIFLIYALSGIRFAFVWRYSVSRYEIDYV